MVQLARRADPLAGRASAGGPGRPRRRWPAPRLPELEIPLPTGVRPGESGTTFDVVPSDGGGRLTVVGRDRVGLLADVAATLAVLRVPVRAARAWSQDDLAVSVWEVADAHLDPAVLRTRFEAVADGRVDPTSRLRAGAGAGLAATVDVPGGLARLHRARGAGR
ncbi:MAG: hypothetical protein R2734_12445 [Nocardioides sp.]